jgi:hypothetical protein
MSRKLRAKLRNALIGKLPGQSPTKARTVEAILLDDPLEKWRCPFCRGIDPHGCQKIACQIATIRERYPRR